MWQQLLAFLTSLLALFAPQPAVTSSPSPVTATPSGATQAVTVAATNLEVPWALAFLPDGKALFTERRGRLKLLDHGVVKPIATVAEVTQIGEGGLLGLAIDPNYSLNKYIYLYYTYQGDDRQTANRVVRYTFEQERISSPTILVDAIPGAPNHNGGRLKFGPDGFLYITTGDAQDPSQAQDKNTLAGKILRWKANLTEVYSYGHRNPQGLAWDNLGRLWSVEHGPSAHDEVNLIKPNGNYGWPTITGDQRSNDLISPVVQSGSDTWAPSGMDFKDQALYFAGLRGQSLFKGVIAGDSVKLTRLMQNRYGRLRDVVVGPDGNLYVLTSNRDGRGNPTANDDQILVINTSLLDKE